MKLPELFRTYLSSKRQLSSVTAKNYASDIRKFITWFEASFGKIFQAKDLTEDIIRVFQKTHGAKLENVSGQLSIVKGQISPRSFERYFSSLRKFAAFLSEEGYIDKNPFDRLIANSQQPIAKQDPWLLKDFKDYLYVYGASNLTIKNYVVDIDAFTSWLEDALKIDRNVSPTYITNITSITSEVIDEYKQRLIYPLKLSPKTVNRKLSSIRKYLEFAVSQGHLNKQQLTIDNLQLTKKTDSGLQLQDIGQTDKSQLSVVSGSPRGEAGQLSKMPPVRLFQRLLAPYVLFEDFIAERLARFIKNKKLSRKAGISENQLKISEDQIKNIPARIPLYKKLIHHAKYTRPNWYKRYHSYTFTHYFHLAILIVYSSVVGFMLYANLFAEPRQKALAGPIAPKRILSFQGRLTDASDNPIKTATDIRFGIYESETATGSALLWQEVHSAVTPDSDGIFSLLLGTKNGIQSSAFRDHDLLWLGITIGKTPELTPRQRLAAVAYAANSESLQGMLPITDSAASTTNVVLALDSSGNLTMGGTAAPTFAATGGRFKLSGTTLLLSTEASSNGDIDIAPDGIGKIDLQKPIVNDTATGNLIGGAVEINDKVAILATESAVAAFVLNNNTTGGDIIAASSSGTTRFTLANDGDVTLAGGDTITASSLATFTTAPTLGMASTTALNCGDCIDFDDISDSPTLDATTDINLSTLDLYIDLTSTGVFSIRDVATAYWTFDDDSTVDVVFPAAGTIGIDASTTANTTTGGVIDLNVNAGDAAVIAQNIDFIANTGITAATDVIALNINLTQNDADADMFGLRITQAATAVTIAGTDLVECFICLENQENQAAAVSDAIRITSTGATAGSITTGLDFDTTDITTDIELQNGETIDNNVDGQINLNTGVAATGDGIYIDSGATTSTANGLCHSGADADNAAFSDRQIVACAGTVDADFAEQYPMEPGLEYGDVVALGTRVVTTDSGEKILQLVKSQEPYQQNLIGIVSNNYSDFASAGYNIPKEENPMPVALVGRVSVKVTLENGPIQRGDYLTTSSTPGAGMRATKAGPVIGMAFEAFNSNGIGKIMVFVKATWYDPDVYLTGTGELAIQKIGNPESDPLFMENSYLLIKKEADGAESALSRIGAFAKVVAGNISAGFIRTQSIVSPLASIDRVRTNVISPLAQGSEISITLNDSKLEIHESSASDSAVVASIDNSGNATFSGTLTAKSLQTIDALISGELAADNVSANEASISGTLYADKIVANNIEGLEARIASVAAQSVSSIQYTARPASLGEAGVSSESADTTASILDTEYSILNTDFVDIQNLSTDFATFRGGLISFGPTTLAQATVLDSLSIGTSLIIGPNSIDTLSQIFEIQPLKQGAISFMAGAVRIEIDGTLKVIGDAEFAGDVTVGGKLSANIVSPLSDDPLVIARSEEVSTNSALLDIQGSASISGALTSRKLNLAFAEQAFATSDIEATASGSAGTAFLKQYRNEITIKNPNVTEKSLIYITPVGNTNNKVLYIYRQVPENSNIEGVEGSFTVGVNSASTVTDIKFNWIIVN